MECSGRAHALPAMEASQKRQRRGTRTSEKGNDPFALRYLTVVEWRFGSLATDLQFPRDVRFSPGSDQIAASL
jgi:hypothetical protein